MNQQMTYKEPCCNPPIPENYEYDYWDDIDHIIEKALEKNQNPWNCLELENAIREVYGNRPGVADRWLEMSGVDIFKRYIKTYSPKYLAMEWWRCKCGGGR